MHLSILSVPVSDQERAKTFYELVGFETRVDQSFGDRRWLQLGLPQGHATISLVTWFDDLKPGSLRGLVIGVDDFDGEHARISAAGVSISEPDPQQWGRFAYFSDPDGNKWMIRGT